MKLNVLLTILSTLAFGTASSSAIAIVFSTSTGVQPGDAGTITLTEINPTTVEVFVDLINPTYGFLNTGGPHTPFAFSLDGTEAGVTANFLSPTGGQFGASPNINFLTLNLNGGDATPFGNFGIAIDSSAGNGSSNAYFGDLKFELTRPSGLTAASFIANGSGAFFAADLTNGNNTGSQAWRVPTTTTTNVPDGGATLALLGASLAGLAMMKRKTVA